ncbi:DUF1320 domain-containing protein [Clostridiaceae bacterium]|nr:DUF1320 domain-containing protein [Clostridiaceae bacterium]
MHYSTREEVREMLKEGALDPILGDEFRGGADEREALMAPLIDAAIADADGEIDGYLAKRYNVPLSTIPKVINKFSKDIALYNLFSRMGIKKDSDAEIYLTRYNAAVRFLTLVAEGKVSIGADEDGDPVSAAATGFTVQSSPRLFSRTSMRGL